jgi:hypothetical protein
LFGALLAAENFADAANSRHDFITRVRTTKVKLASAAQNLPATPNDYHPVNNKLAMASNMHINKTDEVARNGAFGKILRPEVFPDAPLQK